MSQDVSPGPRRSEASTTQPHTNHSADGASALEPLDRCTEPEEHLSRTGLGTVCDQVVCKRFANIWRERKSIDNLPLAPDHELSRPPADVAQLERDDRIRRDRVGWRLSFRSRPLGVERNGTLSEVSDHAS